MAIEDSISIRASRWGLHEGGYPPLNPFAMTSAIDAEDVLELTALQPGMRAHTGVRMQSYTKLPRIRTMALSRSRRLASDMVKKACDWRASSVPSCDTQPHMAGDK